MPCVKCAAGIGKSTGWVVPVNVMIETEQINVRGCYLVNAISELYVRGCVPGTLDTYYNPYNQNPVNLCEGCAVMGPSKCRRSNLEYYYGDTGSFRCLAEKAGDVAFARHTTVRDNTGGYNAAIWSRLRRSDDYELLCRDGRRVDVDQWRTCNLGRVSSNAVVTSGTKSSSERSMMFTLLRYGQDYYSSDRNADFAMFDSGLYWNDLLFSDSTEQLVWIPPERQNYSSWLGPDFVKAVENLEWVACYQQASGIAAAAAPLVSANAPRLLPLLFSLVPLFALLIR